MKVGDYVRTKGDGYINKIKKVNQYTVLVDGRDLFGEELTIAINEIKKSSPNIIELIQEGDYVNGHKITGKSNLNILYTNDEQIRITSKDIKSIVTKEQFEQMEYKIN